MRAYKGRGKKGVDGVAGRDDHVSTGGLRNVREKAERWIIRVIHDYQPVLWFGSEPGQGILM